MRVADILAESRDVEVEEVAWCYLLVSLMKQDAYILVGTGIDSGLVYSAGETSQPGSSGPALTDPLGAVLKSHPGGFVVLLAWMWDLKFAELDQSRLSRGCLR